MSKITPEHLARAAFVYVRQSTAYQVHNNLESQRRQYGLAEHARQLGWDDVQVVDDDLGRSGGGTARPGFEKLLALLVRLVSKNAIEYAAGTAISRHRSVALKEIRIEFQAKWK